MTKAEERHVKERELVLTLLPATKKQITKKTGLNGQRLEIALRGAWFVHGVYERPTETAKLG